MTSFLAGSALERLKAISDLSTQHGISDDDASLVLATCALEGHRIHVLSRDASVEGGSFGVAECDAVARWLNHILEHDPAPLVMLLDSGGARMSEGLAALGGFRRMFAAAADLWLAELPIIAVCGRTVFGGASMLACLADARLFFEKSLFGMSGPRIVQAVAGADDFNADDKAFVHRVMGGAARAQRRENALVEDDASALKAALRSQLEIISDENGRICAAGTSTALARLTTQLITQRTQLESDALTRNPQRVAVNVDHIDARALTHAGGLARASVDDGVLLGRTRDEGYLYGLISGVWADSWHAWKLASALITQAETAPTANATILLDCPAHATSRALESGMISQYFSLLGLAVRHLHHATGGKVTLIVSGEAAGGVYVALAGGASRVLALPNATIRILPRIAIEQVRPDVSSNHHVSIDDWLRTKVIDALTSP